MIVSPVIQQQARYATVTGRTLPPGVAGRGRTVPSRTSPVSASLPALERTLQTLLSPLDFPDWKSWQTEVHTRLLDLTGADSLCMYTPLANGADA